MLKEVIFSMIALCVVFYIALTLVLSFAKLAGGLCYLHFPDMVTKAQSDLYKVKRPVNSSTGTLFRVFYPELSPLWFLGRDF